MAENQELTFEEAMNELEVLVRRLEEGRMPLEESVGAYERGMALKKICEAKLQAAKLKVDQIVKDAQGEVTLKPLETVA